MENKKLLYIISHGMACLFGTTALFILTINLLKSCFPRVLNQYYPLETLLPNPVLMLGGFLIILCIFLLFNKISKNKLEKRTKKGLPERGTLLLAGALFFLLQTYLIYNYCFETDWDVQVLLDTARHIADRSNANDNSWYYCCYPNNLFLTQIFAIILWITKPLHLGSLDFMAIVACQSMLCVVTAWMMYQICIRLWQRRDVAWLGMFLYLLLVGLSPWTSIPYSDAWGLFFPIALVWLYGTSACQKKRFLRWFLIALFAYVGFKIKPQVIFIFCSLVLVEILVAYTHRDTQASVTRYGLKGFLGAGAGLVIAFLAVLAVVKICPVWHDPAQRFGAPHFLMMGLNQKSIGDYSDEDVIFARQFATARERDKGELKECWRRVREMGPKGLGQLVCEKTLVNYYDGTFFWGKEGYFFKTVFPERNRHLSPFLRNLYYNRTIPGKHYPYWCTASTAIWLGTLLLMFFAVFRKMDRMTAILMLSILLLTLYETFFEARARYLYAYIPFYILLALQGIQALEQGISLLRNRRRKTV